MSGNSTPTQLVCKDCHREFTMTEQEIDFFKSRNLFLPKRCKVCRANRKRLAKTVYDVKAVSRELSINDRNSVELLKRAVG